VAARWRWIPFIVVGMDSAEFIRLGEVFPRTLKEQVVYGETFKGIKGLRVAIETLQKIEEK
jgi:hypothetical protein